jgi:uncharacterized protein YbjT (DUF2867 family)
VSPVLATGATGKFAGLVVPALVSHGIDVRAVVHDPGKKHIPLERGAGETVDADLRDPASLRAALDGADGVFLITPAFAPDATEMGLNLVEAAQSRGSPQDRLQRRLPSLPAAGQPRQHPAGRGRPVRLGA